MRRVRLGFGVVGRCQVSVSNEPPQAERSSDMYQKALQTLLGEKLTPLGN